MTSRAIDRINALDRDGFIALLGPLYEHSPWAAERAHAKAPFPDQAGLASALQSAVDDASGPEKLALIRAHPELAGEKLSARALTTHSLSEQAGAGLDRLGPAETTDWARLNAVYRERFGFPFVICVRLHSRDEILAALNQRLASTRTSETAEAIAQIHEIARLRLADILASLDGRL